MQNAHPSRNRATVATFGLTLVLASCSSENPLNAPEPVVPSKGASLVAEGAKPTSDLPAPSAGLQGTCLELCDKTAPLACAGQGGCAAGCDEMRAAAGACASLMETFMSCLVVQPLANFECNEEGIPGVKDGYCEPEQAAVAKCLMSPT